MTGPGSFAIAGPGPMTASLTPTITWTLATNAVKYNLKVATDLGCTAVVESDANVTGGSQTLSTTLTNGTLYYACVTRSTAPTTP